MGLRDDGSDMMRVTGPCFVLEYLLNLPASKTGEVL